MDSAHVDAIGALAEPSRRVIYDYVVAQHGWVSRDDVVAALGLRKGITAHHLDRLETEGLLASDRQRRNGRSGPGAGRPAKVYRRSTSEVDVSLPARRYDLASTLLAGAIDAARSGDLPIDEAVEKTARTYGQEIAHRVKAKCGVADEPYTKQEAFFGELAVEGFEPADDENGVRVLHNCPFHGVAQMHTELICSMNHQMLDEACRNTGLRAQLTPMEGGCCVRFLTVANDPQEV